MIKPFSTCEQGNTTIPIRLADGIIVLGGETVAELLTSVHELLATFHSSGTLIVTEGHRFSFRTDFETAGNPFVLIERES